MDDHASFRQVDRAHIYQTKGARRRRQAWVALLGATLTLATVLLVWGAAPGGRTGDPLLRAATSPSGSPTEDGAGLNAQGLPVGPDRLLVYQPHQLELDTEPSGATARLRLLDGTVVWEGPTPATIETPGGPLVLEVAHDSCNPLNTRLTLDRDRALELYLDPRGLLHRSIGRFATGSNPKQVAFTPDNREIWASLLGGSGVQVFDAATLEKLADIELGDHGSVEVIFTRDGATAFASQMESASVFEIDRATRTVRRRLKTEGVWTKIIALSPDERTLYAANWSSDDISEIDLPTGSVRRRLPTVRTPRGLYVTPDGSSLYVAGFENGDIARIDLTTGKGTTLITTGGAMRHLVSDGLRLYADDMALDKIYVVDLSTDEVREFANTNEKPNTIDLTPDGRVLYVSNRGENGASYYQPGPEWGSVLAIDTATGAVLDGIVGGNQCTGLDVSPDGRTLAFSDFLDNRVRLYAIPDYETLVAGAGGRAAAHLADIPK